MTPSSRQIKDVLSRIYARLSEVSDTARLDGQVLVGHVLMKPRTWILAHLDYHLSSQEQDQIEKLLTILEEDVPLPYVLGHWEFFGLDFIVTPDTLIPRPESELLVEHALAWLKRNPDRRIAVDVGTGSGCISVALCKRVPNLNMLGSDISYRALKVARSNAHKHGVEAQIDLLQADLLSATQTEFDLICANLPYVPTEALKKLKVYDQEPTIALDGGPRGLDLIQRLMDEAAERLSDHGLLLMEIDSSHGGMALRLAKETFQDDEVRIQSDLAGRDRLIIIETK